MRSKHNFSTCVEIWVTTDLDCSRPTIVGGGSGGPSPINMDRASASDSFPPLLCRHNRCPHIMQAQWKHRSSHVGMLHAHIKWHSVTTEMTELIIERPEPELQTQDASQCKIAVLTSKNCCSPQHSKSAEPTNDTSANLVAEVQTAKLAR